MKRNSIFLILAWAAIAVAAVSCVSPFDNPQLVKSDQTILRLTPVVAGPVTKADDPTPSLELGDDTYNENTITDYYWFIFSDEEGTVLKLSGHVSSDASTEILLDNAFPNGGTGYVYVAANLPEAPGSDVTTLEGLRRISFGTDMPTTYTNSSEFYEYTSATTGVPKPSKFVMRTENLVPFTLQEKTIVDVTASLKRVAAKIILQLNVAKEVEQTKTQPTGLEQYVCTWLSDIEHIQVYMLWGSTHGDLAGTQYHYGDEGVQSSWFYSASPRFAMYTNPVGGSWNGSSYDGSVPNNRYKDTTMTVSSTKWEVVYQRQWVWNADVPEEEQTLNNQDDDHGHWGDYILDENNQRIPVYNADGTVQRQLISEPETKHYWRINSLPLYSMPISWSVNDAHAPFIKVILPWKGYDKNTQTAAQAVSKEFYYKILIPSRTTLDANGCYRITLNVSVLGSEADEVPVALTGQYHVVDWNSPEPMGGNQSAGRYLNCATSFEFFSTDENGGMSIPVKSSHDIEVVSGSVSAKYMDYSNTTAVETDLPASQYTITPTGTSKVTITHSVETNLDDMEGYDVSPITYTFTIQHKGDGGSAYQKTITVTQYPSLYIENRVNSNWTTTGNQYNSQYGYVFVNTPRTTNGQGWQRVVGITSRTSETSSNPNTYLITTKVLDSSLGFIVGDPRVDVIDNLVAANSTTFSSAPALYGNSPRRLAYYYPTEETDRTKTMVAPAFRIASSYGQCYAVDRTDARLRCAAYQEDGYPAGRWRLPTLAEIQYITNLSGSLIPRLFNDLAYVSTSVYMSANGIVSIRNGEVYENTSATTAFVRCVYDEWFWGSDRVSNTQFTWGDKQR